MTAPKTTPEGASVAKVDLSKMSFADLKEIAKEAAELADMKRGEEIKVLADGYAKKAAAAGFTPQEAIDALLPYAPAKKARAARGTAVKKAVGPKPTPGATYKDPATGATWTKAASGKGKTKAWLQAHIDAGKKYEDFLVK